MILNDYIKMRVADSILHVSGDDPWQSKDGSVQTKYSPRKWR